MKKLPFPVFVFFFVIFFSSCKNELDISYSMSGDWYAEYAAQDTVAKGEYSRVVQAYHFDGNGTGYWYKFLLPADSDEPIDMYGGHVFGTFTYTMGDEGVLNIHLDNDINGTERTRQLTYGEGLMMLLRQPQGSPMSLSEQVILLVAAVGKVFLPVPVEKLPQVRLKVLDYFKEKRKAICARIDKTGELTDGDKKNIIKLSRTVVKRYLEAEAEKAPKEPDKDGE